MQHDECSDSCEHSLAAIGNEAPGSKALPKTIRCEKCGKEGPLYAEMVGGTLQRPLLKYFVMHPRISKSSPRPTKNVMFHELVGYKPEAVKKPNEDEWADRMQEDNDEMMSRGELNPA